MQEITIYINWAIVIFLMISSMFISVLQNAIPWTYPINNRARWKRSIVIGVSTIVFCVSAFTAASLYSSHGEPPPIKAIMILSCIALPLGILATFGSYFGFGLIDQLKVTRDRLEKKSKIDGSD